MIDSFLKLCVLYIEIKKNIVVFISACTVVFNIMHFISVNSHLKYQKSGGIAV